MLYQQYIKSLLQRIKYQLLNLHKLAYVPIFLVYAVVLSLFLMNFYTQTQNVTELAFLNYTQILIPLASIWCPLFVLKEYLESDGNELLQLYGRRQFLIESACIFTLFMLIIFPLYASVHILINLALWEYLKMILSCVFCFGLMYFLAFSTRALALTLMGILLYIIFQIILYRDRVIFPFYYSLNAVSAAEIPRYYLPLALVGLFFLFLGNKFSKKNIRYQ